jgi:Amt family ammonium transporter
MKYSLLFVGLWSVFVYCPIGHWVWNEGGFLHVLGARDYAGGFVVHMSSGFSALITSLVLGKRRNYGSAPEVVNFPFVILGTMLLWFGWFGFNGGSSYAMNKVAVSSILNTNISASVSLFIWLIMDLLVYNRISALSIAMGTVSGLVAITPGAGYIASYYSFIFGLLAGLVCWITVIIRKKYQLYDDLDVFTCHGIAGSLGILATGFFAERRANASLLLNGVFFAKEGENRYFILYQMAGIVIVVAYASLMTFVILIILKKSFNIRAKSEEEIYYDHINFFDEYNSNVLKKINVEVIR